MVKDCKIDCHEVADTVKIEMLPFIRESLENDFRKYKFSLIIDESTDISKKRFLVIMVEYFKSKEGVICRLYGFKEC